MRSNAQVEHCAAEISMYIESALFFRRTGAFLFLRLLQMLHAFAFTGARKDNPSKTREKLAGCSFSKIEP